MNHLITQARLKELLRYDPETGVFTWRATGKGRRLNRQAGTVQATGYLTITIDWRIHLAHRLAFLYVVGDWPPNEIDHIDGDQSNNRWCNLRPATRSQNMANSISGHQIPYM